MPQVPLPTRHFVWFMPVVVIFVGCSGDARVSPPRPGQDLSVLVYDGGRIAASVVLARGESGWKRVLDVVDSKQGKWDESAFPVAYAPVILMASDGGSFNFQQGRVIAEFVDGKGKAHQVIAPLTTEEFKRVQEAASVGHKIGAKGPASHSLLPRHNSISGRV